MPDKLLYITSNNDWGFGFMVYPFDDTYWMMEI